LVRKLADEHGVDLTNVVGTGVGGRIRKQDILEAAKLTLADRAEGETKHAAEAAAAAATASAQPDGRTRSRIVRDPAAASWRDALIRAQERRTTQFLQPRTYEELRTIGEHFREGNPVVVDLTGMADSDGKRAVDFAAGLIYGLHGSIERVSNKMFLLSPANVKVTAEYKAQIVEWLNSREDLAPAGNRGLRRQARRHPPGPSTTAT
jgi:cell division inhibitor SepF